MRPTINHATISIAKIKNTYGVNIFGTIEVFSDPLRERATAVIVAHNHPSGILIPSNDDINVTQRLLKAGELLGIRVLDHLIFSDEGFRSMLEENELT